MSKKILLLTLCIATALVGCTRKKVLLDDIDVIDYPDHCYNEMLDADEVGVDCGGSCEVCTFVEPTCTVPSNTVKLYSNSGNLITSYTTENPSCGYNSDDFFEFTCEANNWDYFTIVVRDFDPTIVYTPVNSSTFLTTTEVWFDYDSYSTYGSLTPSDGSGKVYLGEDVNGRYFVICDVKCYSYVTNGTYKISAKVYCN